MKGGGCTTWRRRSGATMFRVGCVSLIVGLFAAGCGPRSAADRQRSEGGSPGSSPAPPEGAVDHFPDKADVRYAQGFSVSYHGHYKVVRVSADAEAMRLSENEAEAWQAATVDVLVLVQRGTTPPPRTGALAEATFLEVPIRSAAVNRDADARRIQALGFADRLVGIGGAGIYDPELRARVEAGTLPSIGSALHRTMDLELLLTTAPDAIFLRIASLTHTVEFQRLRDLGLVSVPMVAWAETTGLARAEWLLYVALFFNAEAEAARQFAEVEARVEELRDVAAGKAERPTAVWAFSPRAGGWRAHSRGIEAGLLEDAGLRNVMAHDAAPLSEGRVGHSEGVQISNEQFLRQAGEAEIWITWSPTDETWPSGRYLADIRAYREDRVYHHRKRRIPETGADDWYELAQLRPDVVLADLVAVAHPELLPDHELVFLERLRRTR